MASSPPMSRYASLRATAPARALTCASPCTWCGAEGTQRHLYGAVLRRVVKLRPGDTVRGLGLWVSLPEGGPSVTVSVEGDVFTRSIVVLSAVRAYPLDAHRVSTPWTCPFAQHAALATRGARHLVLELAGRACAVGSGTVHVRVTLAGVGCLTCPIAVVVDDDEPAARSVASLYLATHALDAPAFVRLVDALLVPIAPLGPLTLRAHAEGGAMIEGAVAAAPRGLVGEAYDRCLRVLARSRIASVDVWRPGTPESVGFSAAFSTRARPAPTEFAAWCEPAGGSPTVEEISRRWWQSVDPEATRPLQCVIGTRCEPVSPRVPTSWEQARGVDAVTDDLRWLGRYLRAPGERAWCRDRLWSGDDARACWPGVHVWNGTTNEGYA